MMTFLEFCRQHNVRLTERQEELVNAAIPELEKMYAIGGGKTFILNLLDLYMDFRIRPSDNTNMVRACHEEDCKPHYHVGRRK